MKRDLLEKDGALKIQHAPAHGRLPQLDGLRAIAILMVFFHHSTDRLPIGWVGVHLFFVLSGFLITGILWRAREDEFYWKPFYIKRATRILPPLLPFFVACAFVVSINWKTTGLAYLFFGANIVQSLPNAQVNDLAILWSLAVEEHFYFVWPFAVRYLSRRSLIWLLVGLVVADPIARAMATHHVAGWAPIYQLTCFQVDALAAGALMALVVQSAACRAWLARYAGMLAVAAGIVFAVCARNPVFAREQNSVSFNLFGYTLIVFGCVFSLAYLSVNDRSFVSRALSFRPLVFFGTISYGLYLYNGLVGDAVRWAFPIPLHHRGANGLFKLILEFGLSILVSWLSFRFYESRVIRWGRDRANALSVRGGRTLRAVQTASGER